MWLEMTRRKPNRIIWWEPRWSFVPREVREFRSSFRLRSWLRIILVSYTAVVAIAIIANAVVPGLKFNWLGAFFASIAAIVGFLLILLALVTTIPPLVFITEYGFGWWWPVLLHDGFSYFKRSDLQSVTITVRDDGKHYLRLRTKRFCRRIGLGRRVDLNDLVGLFGDLLVVRDRRRSSRE